MLDQSLVRTSSRSGYGWIFEVEVVGSVHLEYHPGAVQAHPNHIHSATARETCVMEEWEIGFANC